MWVTGAGRTGSRDYKDLCPGILPHLVQAKLKRGRDPERHNTLISPIYLLLIYHLVFLLHTPCSPSLILIPLPILCNIMF